MVFGFIPTLQAEELKQAIAELLRREDDTRHEGQPEHPRRGWKLARRWKPARSMAEKTRNILINDILNETAIYLAGGDEVKGSILLEDKVQDAATSCLDRLFPQFHQADTPDWHKVDRAGQEG